MWNKLFHKLFYSMKKTKTVEKINSKNCIEIEIIFYINICQMNSKMINIFYLLF
jgi:hypothetical protein